ncbi:MAG TPA: DegT/DnrJ/EryC1/StrS family aminotransferase, partial [Myxococcota bacterium]
EIEALCSGRGVPVVEDTAQAFGARVEGRRLGTFGDVGVYSFGTYKNLNTWYGGAVTCANPERFAAIRKQVESWTPRSAASLVRQMLKGLSTDVATHPALFRTLTYWIFRFGALHDIRAINRFVQTELDLSRREELPRAYRGQMTPAQQRLGLAQLPHVDRDNAARVEKAARYRRGLEDLGGLVLPPDAASGIYTYFPVQWPGGEAERRRLLRYLTERGCDIGPQHLKNCADLPAFREFARDCPNAREAADAVVLLPTYPRYPNRDVDRNLEVLRAYAAARGV